MLNKMATTLDFGSLINRERPFLRQLAMKLTKHVDDAEDLIQETLFKALKNQDKYQPETNLKGWLYTIMKNTFINQYRKKKFQNTYSDDSENQYITTSMEATRSDEADHPAEHAYVLQQIQTVEKAYLDAFMMYFNGYKYEEISDILNIPLGTVKSRIFLARKKMMEKLKDHRYE
jgi:RNA polymerase sigma-70 factor (ECF subfamily)